MAEAPHEQCPEESTLNRSQVIRADALPGRCLSQTGWIDLVLERILPVYFSGIQVSLDRKAHRLLDYPDTSPTDRGCHPPRETFYADYFRVGDALVTRSVSASLEVESTQLEARRGSEPRVIPDFCNYCLEILDRLTKT